MKKIVIILLIFFVVGGIYYKLQYFNNVDTILDAGGGINQGTGKIEGPDIEREIFNNLWSNKTDGLIISVPETQAKAVLNTLVSRGDQDFSEGFYQDEFERGQVIFDHNSIRVISKINDNKNEVYYAAPFHISNQGSGVFGYIGLFKYDKEQKKSTQLDSYFLGDRIAEVKLADGIQAVKVSFLSYLEEQDYYSSPEQENSIQLQIQRHPVSFQLNSIYVK